VAMVGDRPATRPTPLSSRADLALLALQLRSVLREAEEAEATERDRAVVDPTAQLRERLGTLGAERRAALAAELDRVRAEAQAEVAAARERAAAEVARAEDEQRDRLARAAALTAAEDDVAIEWDEPLAEQPVVDEPVTSQPVAVETPAPLPAPVAGTAAANVTVVFDVEAFARAFAAAFVTAMEHRDHVAPRPTYVVQQPPAKKSGFWAHAWHADVLLALVAMVIVLAVLAAWTS
jgi:hypothetical protein